MLGAGAGAGAELAVHVRGGDRLLVRVLVLGAAGALAAGGWLVLVL